MSNQICPYLPPISGLSRGQRFASALLIISCTLIGTAGCQKAEETETPSDVQVTKITPDTQSKPTTSVETEVGNNELDNESESDAVTPSADEQSAHTTDAPQSADKVLTNADIPTSDDDLAAATDQAEVALSPTESKALLEKQITDVEYRSASGQSLKVTFQTSALETLEADVLLPSGQKVVLTAPKGQGNNPTYRSKDGSIELVTHGGGGSIDLLYDGDLASFDAVSADAEVITPP